MEKAILKEFISYQKDEIQGYKLYTELAILEKNPVNKQILLEIADQELKHYEILKKYTNASPTANSLSLWFYKIVFRLLGITFGVKLMEMGEAKSEDVYTKYYSTYPEVAAISVEEEEHEERLIAMMEDKGLYFIGSIVLGMNDALVELTGSLAGFTLALQNSSLIALLGIITGIAAGMSMAASEYFSTKAEKGTKIALQSAGYTGVSYLITVALLIIPYLIFSNIFVALGLTLFIAVIIIALFNFYYSVVKGESFKKRFLEMLIVSFTVVGISFFIGYLLKRFTGISV